MLKNFRLVNTDGLKGLFIKGRLIPFDKIDDTIAEQLIGKMHVLERVPDSGPTPQPQLALAAAEFSDLGASQTEAPAASRKRASN